MIAGVNHAHGPLHLILFWHILTVSIGKEATGSDVYLGNMELSRRASLEAGRQGRRLWPLVWASDAVGVKQGLSRRDNRCDCFSLEVASIGPPAELAVG